MARFAMGQHRVQGDRQRDRRQGPCPASAHGVGDGDPHRRGRTQLVPFKIGKKVFEILDRHSSGGAAAGDARQVRRVESQFGHARFHPRRHVTGSRGMGRDRQPAHRRLDFLPPALRRRSAPVVRRAPGLLPGLGRTTRSQARRIVRAGFQIAQHRADGITLIQFDQPFLHPPAARGGHVHDGFVGLDLDDVLIGIDFLTDSDEQMDHGRFGNRFAQLRHDDGDLSHRDYAGVMERWRGGVMFDPKPRHSNTPALQHSFRFARAGFMIRAVVHFAPPPRCCGRSGGARPRDWGDRAPVCPWR